MKDLLKMAMVAVALLALFMVVRIALFVPLHHEMLGARETAPIEATDRDCAVRQVKMPCFRHANPEVQAMASVPLQSGAADAETIAARDTHCAARQVKFPCFQNTDRRG